ncbi:DUF2569 family protein [Robertmurraya sp. Marseille-Q9965]
MEKKQYYGIKGWLLLVLVGLIIMPVVNILYLKNDLFQFFDTDVWYGITNSGTEFYHPLFGIFVIYEVFLNVILSLVPIILIFLMFRKSRIFPKSMILYLAGTLFLQCIDSFLAYNIYSGTPAFAEGRREMQNQIVLDTLRYAVYSVIWIRYFQVSKRVKVTFLDIHLDLVSTGIDNPQTLNVDNSK